MGKQENSTDLTFEEKVELNRQRLDQEIEEIKSSGLSAEQSLAKKQELINHIQKYGIKEQELTERQKDKLDEYAKLVVDEFTFSTLVHKHLLEFYLHRITLDRNFVLTNRIIVMNRNFLANLDSNIERVASLRQSVDLNYKGLFEPKDAFVNQVELEEFTPPQFADGKPEWADKIPKRWEALKESVKEHEKEKEELNRKNIEDAIAVLDKPVGEEVIVERVEDKLKGIFKQDDKEE